MSRTCARPGCDRHAVATLSYNYANSVVFLEDLAPQAHPMVHDLCGPHADTLRVPRGWTLQDSRRVTSLPMFEHRKTA
ncbi:MAG: DUF3499 domain-containing protein [Microthrixaceae bacterium]|nr:DUF3499 family protein [Microthrixaceae bacterium]MCO5313801.1 DUF3499 domain-containing protein [Microthrixaceae bacterium]HPB46196.1 DUF3499 family protein [Microthrixaceae bacterium]